jgi:hypothetical protein
MKKIFVILTLFVNLSAWGMADEQFMCKVPVQGVLKPVEHEASRSFTMQPYGSAAPFIGGPIDLSRKQHAKLLAFRKHVQQTNPDCYEPREELLRMVYGVLKACDIRLPVIVFQNNRSMASCSNLVVDQHSGEIIGALIELGTLNRNYSTIRFAIYHECKHILEKDSLIEVSDTELLELERRADLFAIQQLMKRSDFESLMLVLLDTYIDKADGRFDEQMDHHPSARERGIAILEAFKNAGVQIDYLPFAVCADPSTIKQLLKDHITSSFPAYKQALGIN